MAAAAAWAATVADLVAAAADSAKEAVREEASAATTVAAGGQAAGGQAAAEEGMVVLMGAAMMVARTAATVVRATAETSGERARWVVTAVGDEGGGSTEGAGILEGAAAHPAGAEAERAAGLVGSVAVAALHIHRNPGTCMAWVVRAEAHCRTVCMALACR